MEKLGNGKKYYIFTMGCQLNENDSEKIAGMLEKEGWIETNEPTEADLVVFNTCCVRENAEEKLFGKVGEFKNQKRDKGTIIAIGGCMMQEEHTVKKLKESYPYVDVIFGTHTLKNFIYDLEESILSDTRVRDIANIDGEVVEGLPIKRKDKIKASVTIMYGCDNYCTYCIVPYVRGRERSRKAEDIIKEVEDVAKQGYKEITLLGQNVNSYKGEDCDNFAKLLYKVNEVEGIEKIRFISPHPKDFTDDVIDAIRDCDKVSKLIHLPLQSGSTNVLKKMNRNYTKEQYLELVDKIRSKIPNATFMTDIIVGFPGETEEDFEDTLDVVSKVKYDQVYMFIYSRRKGTIADNMENQIPEDVKHKRFDRLKALVESQMSEVNSKYIGTTEKILVEGYSKNNENMLSGRTDSNKVIVFEGSKDLIGTIQTIKIKEDHQWYLSGEII